MNEVKLKDYISYLKSNPDAYVEMVTGRKLPLWQRLIVKVMSKMDIKKDRGYIEFKNGSIIYCSSSKNNVRSRRCEVCSFYCSKCKEVHKNYKMSNIQFIGERYQMCKESYDELLESYINSGN